MCGPGSRICSIVIIFNVFFLNLVSTYIQEIKPVEILTSFLWFKLVLGSKIPLQSKAEAYPIAVFT